VPLSTQELIQWINPVLRGWGVPPPILNEPILFYSVDPPKVAGFEICVENFTDMGAIIGTAMGGQKGVSEGGIP